MNSGPCNPWLQRLAVFAAAMTLGLIGLGGMVTSKGVGMAVPDWPTTYGENMFLFPVSQWIGGVFYEHTHRLLASAVGLLTASLAAWVWFRDSAGRGRVLGLAWIGLGLTLIGVRHQSVFITLAVVALGVGAYCLFQLRGNPRPMRWWCLLAYSLVLVQGTLGGLRVTLYKDELGIVHGTVAQLFFVLVCAIALVMGGFWRRLAERMDAARSGQLAPAFLVVTLMIFAQLVLGASMRHQHAGLAVPDFPLAYGKILPPLDAEFIAEVNRTRLDPREYNPITAGHIVLHMTHRVLAAGILGAVITCVWLARKRAGLDSFATKAAHLWLGLILVQAILGAATVWSNKSVELATLHVVVGAVSLAFGGLLTLACFQAARLTASVARESSCEVPVQTRLSARPC